MGFQAALSADSLAVRIGKIGDVCRFPARGYPTFPGARAETPESLFSHGKGRSPGLDKTLFTKNLHGSVTFTNTG
jgi:hypothetical protein